jgi:UDP-N-acetylmuramate: L-alanyl-gamma-D-glutamyl-meso-diaminopimelate ligase
MHIYFMGICGTAMGNAALLLQAQGHQVSGADSGIYPPMSTVLETAGIEIFEGFDADRLSALNPDKVVVGNVMSRGNPEVEWLLNQDALDYTSLPQLFRNLVLPGRLPIVIAGTHGKTTTATLTAYLLERNGVDPGWLIGGVPHDLPSGAHLGKGSAFVIEGDEYDSAFFDKRSKCIHYRPQIAVLNNLEFDHADIFRDLKDVQRSFAHFLRVIPSAGFALINGDDPNIAVLMPIDWTQVVSVGVGEKNMLQIRAFEDGPEGAQFELWWQGQMWGRIAWGLHGLYNARNAAMAALAAALGQGFENPTDFGLEALDAFQGVQRRQDVLLKKDTQIVLEDFAHHPTAIKGAIEGLRAAFPDYRLHVCFEPRSNTATRALFQDAFTDALAGADSVYLGAVHRGDRLLEVDRLDTKKMSVELKERGLIANAYASNSDLLAALKQNQVGDATVVVFFTNGAFDGIQHAFVQALDEQA